MDVDACTRSGVLLTITPDGVRRPVATSLITLVLALAQKLLIKDRLTRAGRWGERVAHMGLGLTGRTLGLIGLGSIGREAARLARPFDLRLLAYDPYVPPADAAALGVELVELPVLLRTADFVGITLRPDRRDPPPHRRRAPLAHEADRLPGQRRPRAHRGSGRADGGACASGASRGPASTSSSRSRSIPRIRSCQLDNVIVTPHSICWTDECFLGNGRAAIGSILDVAAGRTPRHVVNRAALDHPRIKARLGKAG